VGCFPPLLALLQAGARASHRIEQFRVTVGTGAVDVIPEILEHTGQFLYLLYLTPKEDQAQVDVQIVSFAAVHVCVEELLDRLHSS
jgi:hypothetical protein